MHVAGTPGYDAEDTGWEERSMPSKSVENEKQYEAGHRSQGTTGAKKKAGHKGGKASRG